MDTRRSMPFSAALLFSLFLTTLLLLPNQGLSAQDLVEMQKDPNQWVAPGKNYALTRYSELNQITTDNVKNLELQWVLQESEGGLDVLDGRSARA